MKVLGIDTVTRVGSIAVVEDGKIITEQIIDTHLQHAARLISTIDNVIGSSGMDISDIEAIAIDVGPGSFTGIRVGIASALGLAQLNNKSLVGLCSLELLALKINSAITDKLFIPIIDAKRGCIYSACYKSNNGNLIEIKKPYVTKLDLLLKEVKEDSVLFGPDMGRFLKEIPEKFKNSINENDVFPEAGILAKLAESRIKNGSALKKIEPMYLYDVEYKVA